jgi:hypothetical protein
MPTPENGQVLSATYVNAYFDLSFPLPDGWTEGEPGPDPSDAGYYVLGSFIPRSEPKATILVAAQDMFFGSRSYGNAAEMARDFRQDVSKIDGMVIDREPAEVRIAASIAWISAA